MKEFVNSVIEHDDGIISFVNSFMGKTRSLGMGDYTYKIEHTINMKTVAMLIDPKEIEPRLRKILSSEEFGQMDEERKLAVTTFLDTLDGKIKEH